MTNAHPTQATGGITRAGKPATAATGLAELLCLAATPVFAIMALLTGLPGDPMDRLCSAGHGAPLSGMVVMYLLMSAFHSPPWLALINDHRAGMIAGFGTEQECNPAPAGASPCGRSPTPPLKPPAYHRR
ncbi:MAG TPA: hypothetical protein VGG99_27120 [Acetobacteraceae bacterium]|jgi:hypothetical protein